MVINKMCLRAFRPQYITIGKFSYVNIFQWFPLLFTLCCQYKQKHSTKLNYITFPPNCKEPSCSHVPLTYPSPPPWGPTSFFLYFWSVWGPQSSCNSEMIFLFPPWFLVLYPEYPSYLAYLAISSILLCPWPCFLFLSISNLRFKV